MNIIFIDEHNSSLQNGIGTYRDLLLLSLGRIKSVSVTLISLNSYVENLTILVHDFGTEYAIPFISNGNWRECGPIICPLINIYLKDDDCNIFIFNHSPCADFIRHTRKAFPKSKILFVIHDQGWCSELLGNVELLTDICSNTPSAQQISENQRKLIKSYCESEKEIYHLADKVICLSPSFASILKNIYKIPKSKISIIPNGYKNLSTISLDKESARKYLGIPKDDEILIFAGRPVYHKGIAPLFQAIRILMNKRKKLKCVLCGNLMGFSEYLENITTISSRLIFTGLIPKEQLNIWYQAADVGIMPSYSEPFGYSGIEMIDMGLPLIVSDGIGVTDIYPNNLKAFVAKIGEDKTMIEFFANNLADNILNALDISNDKRHKFNNTNRALLDGKYSLNTMCSNYLKVFNQILTT